MGDLRAIVLAAIQCALFGCGGDDDDDLDAAAGADAAVTSDAGRDASEPDGGANACGATASGRVSLPADDAAHDEPVEWWYWTGHLRTDDGRWFGFEEVFFRVVQGGMTGGMAHVGLTDIDDGSFHFRSNESFGDYRPSENGFDLELDGLAATGGDGHDALTADVDDYSLQLALESRRPAVLQHGDGYADYPWGGYTYYYSRERMEVDGTVTVGGEALPVTGTGWFDHQYGDLNSTIDAGWDWFALQLDDEREVMLFVVRDAAEEVLVGGSMTDENCVTTQIAPEDFSVVPTGEWESADGCRYPSGWDVTVPGLSLTVTPVLADQELTTAVVRYWEGAATVTGDATGRAYIELTGYCE